MIILSTLSLLISNAVSLRRDMSILYNRIAIIALLYAILQSLISFIIESIRLNHNNVVLFSTIYVISEYSYLAVMLALFICIIAWLFYSAGSPFVAAGWTSPATTRA